MTGVNMFPVGLRTSEKKFFLFTMLILIFDNQFDLIYLCSVGCSYPLLCIYIYYIIYYFQLRLKIIDRQIPSIDRSTVNLFFCLSYKCIVQANWYLKG